MNFLKDEPKSWTTRESDVNPNTIIENNFLEEFFRHMIADVHQGKILNFRQKLHHIKQLERSAKSLAERLFEVTEEISLQAVMRNLNDFILQKSPSFADGELNQLLEMKFSNTSAPYPTYKPKQLLLVDVKIKADSERIQNMPMKMKEMLSSLERKAEYCPIAERLRNYEEEYINFVVVYFGYYNFSMVKNTHFEDKQICLFGRNYKIRVNAIFVSKVALMETFKTFCKVPNLEEIDEMLIQLYELKREKLKAKKKKKLEIEFNKSQKEKQHRSSDNIMKEKSKNLGLKAVIGITAVGVAVAIGNFFR